MHYNWFRYYDPSTGRYITADPIGLSGGVNLYGYVDASPLTHIDPYGLFLEEAGEFFSGFANTITFGGAGYLQTQVWRLINYVAFDEIIGNESIVDECSGWYMGGVVAGVAWDIAIGAGGGLTELKAFRFGKETKYWNYYTKGKEGSTSTKWLAKGTEPPYKLGEEARKALNLPESNLADAVREVNVPWYKPVRGPATPIPQPKWGWKTPGAGKEYYQGWKWDRKYWLHSSMPPAK